MKVRIISIILVQLVLFTACSQKKKQFVPIVGLLQDSSTASSSSGSAGTGTSVSSTVNDGAENKGTTTGEVKLVAGGSNSDISQTPTDTSPTSVPVVSVTGDEGTISSTKSEATTTTTNSSTNALTTNGTTTGTTTTSSQTNTDSTNVSSSSGDTDSTKSSGDKNVAESSNTNSNNTSNSSGETNSFGTLEPAVTVVMGSSSNSSVNISGSILDSKGNTIGGANVSINGLDSNGQPVTIHHTSSSNQGAISGQFDIPRGINVLIVGLSISGKETKKVRIPVSIEAECKANTGTDSSKDKNKDSDKDDKNKTSSSKDSGKDKDSKSKTSSNEECDGDHDKGHGNDADGIDEDNPGSSTGISSNAMENRKVNDKDNGGNSSKCNKDTVAVCKDETKHITRIGNIVLPVEASSLAFLQEHSDLMAYINGNDENHTLAVILIILFAGAAIFLRRKFLTA